MESQTTTTSWPASDLHALADLLADLAPAALPSQDLDQLEALERIKAAAAAAQVVITATFADVCDTEDVPDHRSAYATAGDVDRRRGRPRDPGQPPRGRTTGAALTPPA